MGFLILLLVIGGFIYFIFRPTPYQPKGFMGGYSETRLGSDMYSVKFQGNGNTRPDRSVDLCMLRCADLTLSKGYKYFYLIDNKTGNQGYIPSGRYGPISSHPSTNNTIQMVNEKPEGAIAVYEADIIAQSYRQKYRIK
jgi:hypothetical protein